MGEKARLFHLDKSAGWALAEAEGLDAFRYIHIAPSTTLRERMETEFSF